MEIVLITVKVKPYNCAVTKEGVWSVFHSEVGGSCLAWFPLCLHGIGVGVGHFEVVQCLWCVPCTHKDDSQ